MEVSGSRIAVGLGCRVLDSGLWDVAHTADCHATQGQEAQDLLRLGTETTSD